SQIRDLLRTAVLCNDAHLSSIADKGSGDPMEIALLRAGMGIGLIPADLLRENSIIRKYAFDPDTKMMATVHVAPPGFLVAVKGAPEAVLSAARHVVTDQGLVDISDSIRAEWLDRASALGERGLRVLACATRTTSSVEDSPYQNLVLIGLIGLEDPPRADVAEAIQHCQHAGIRVVMVTGDHAVTARSIAQTVGISDADSPVLEGRQIDALIDTGITELRKVSVFARVNPAEKLALVKAYQEAGDIVAMTGDGVNDAPALRRADIGVAMGLRGTDVARQAADMILLDDSFSTIVKAIRQGRVIFGNIRRVVVYLLSCNVAEIMVVGIAVASTLPLPLMPLQLLYLNLVTDVFPAFALAMDEGDAGILERPPQSPHRPILGQPEWRTILLASVSLTGGTFAALMATRWLSFSADQSVTVTFMTLAFAQLWHVFNMQSPNANFLRNENTRNGWLWAALVLCIFLLIVPSYVGVAARILTLSVLTPPMWGIVLVCSMAPLVLARTMQALVIYLRRREI
ncbi:MAG: cation-transporting P-type ATPase, partial [Alphaproteobacteria bacterium]|nr:cation-transporting P-type ATPase [Alphaproteobacteria bacterium]